MNFGHGVGHGVGYFLCVHEGPIGISPYRNQELVEGHVVSDGKLYFFKLRNG